MNNLIQNAEIFLLIQEAREYFHYKWPDQLDSGVMFFKGWKITKEEFETGYPPVGDKK